MQRGFWPLLSDDHAQVLPRMRPRFMMTGRGARELGRGRWARVILAAGAEGEGQSEGKSKSRDEGEGESEGQGEARFERAHRH